MNAEGERALIRALHQVLNVPIVGFLYGPVPNIPRAAFFTRVVVFPLVVASGIWLWLKPRFLRWWRQHAPQRSDFTNQADQTGPARLEGRFSLSKLGTEFEQLVVDS
jgi:hypothetical protein